MKKTIMVQGTMSNVGKSLVTAGLCRIFKQDGYRVVPFKSQNMALNSYVTADGLEMGRAQAVQAEACGLAPAAAMNPILLKPTSDTGSQVIVMGKPIGNMNAMDYYKKKKDYIPVIMDAYRSLKDSADIVVIEGAGSPVEINLKENDIVNMGLARLTDASVLLVGDIDRGGVFAQLLGTMELLEREERDRVRGFIINKFRGDVEILRPGLKMIEDRCDKPVLGVVPYFNTGLEDEDSLSEDLLMRASTGTGSKIIDIAVIRLPRIGNFTDLNAFKTDRDVSVRYVERADSLGCPDMVVIPGTKNTIADAKHLKESGLYESIRQLAQKGVVIFGICGGYQLMGMTINDRENLEGGGHAEGLALLPIDTEFCADKITRQISGRISKLMGPFESLSGVNVSGYEIHMGRSYKREGAVDLLEGMGTAGVSDSVQAPPDYGCVRDNCMGTYLHGIFDDTEFRGNLIEILYTRKKMARKETSVSYLEFKERQYDKLADILRSSLDIGRIYDDIIAI